MSIMSVCCRRGCSALASRGASTPYLSAQLGKVPTVVNQLGVHIRLSAVRNVTRCNSTAHSSPSNKHKIVFLGTPEVAALALKELLAASQRDGCNFEVSAIVTQPPRPKGRGNTKTPIPSPVQQLAEKHGIAKENIYTPVTAKEDSFLETLQRLEPDLCVTAAYGNMLPKRFLAIPRFGTLNIHPSLLPKYRGAAPVQRALQDGVTETGVSVLFTVLKCDAGPVLAQKRAQVPLDVQAPQQLDQLFVEGAQLLISCLPDVFAGRGAELAVPQDESQATHAAKMEKEEGLLDFSLPALALHNKVRAFAGWPGTFARLKILDDTNGKSDLMELKVLRTTVDQGATATPGSVTFHGGVMLIGCGDGSVLQVLDIQVPTKKPSSAKEFKNGLGRKTVVLAHESQQPDALLTAAHT